MKKFNFDGHLYIKLDDLKYEIRKLRNNIDTVHSDLDDWQKTCMRIAYNDIVKSIFLEEYSSTEDSDEKEAILEMSGSFVVTKFSKIRKPLYFCGFENGEPTVSYDVSYCLTFSYETTAKTVAENLGEGWEVVDVSAAAHEEIKKMIALFAEDLKSKDPENPMLEKFKDRIEAITETSKENFNTNE